MTTAATASPTTLHATQHNHSRNNSNNNCNIKINNHATTTATSCNINGMGGGNPALRNIANLRLINGSATSATTATTTSAASSFSSATSAAHSSLNATFKQKCTTWTVSSMPHQLPLSHHMMLQKRIERNPINRLCGKEEHKSEFMRFICILAKEFL